jgi:hypothetical protein
MGIMSDLEDIKQLKYRYFRLLDLKKWDEFAECFVPGATGDYAGLTFGDRESLVAYMRENLGADRITLHQAHHPEVVVDGDTATGTWYLQDKVIVPEFGFLLEGAGIYADRYVRTPDGWRFAHTGYRRTYELTGSLEGLTLKVGDAYDA